MSRAQKPSAESIADAIVADIQSGRLAPGDRVREQDLAGRFSTSRGPVREALKILASQHWIQHEPGRGATVIHMDRSNDPDASVLGVALSRAMVRFVAARATDAELAELVERVRALAKAAQGEVPPETFAEMAWDSGRFLLRISRSSLLSQFMESIQRGGIPHISIATFHSRRRRIEAAQYWVDLVIALQRRDGDAAEQSMVNQLQAARQWQHRAAINADLFEIGWQGV